MVKGITIRKLSRGKWGGVYNPSRKEMDKQVLTLFKKSRKELPGLTFEYVTENNIKTGNGFHTHILSRNVTDITRLKSVLTRFIGGYTTVWSPLLRFTQYEDGGFRNFENVEEISGAYGTVTLLDIIFPTQYSRYMNKYGQSRQLV